MMRFLWIAVVLAGSRVATGVSAGTLDLFPPELGHPESRVVIVQDSQATAAFEPQMSRIREMVLRGLTNLTGKSTAEMAWRSLVSTQDVVGLKVYSSPGPNSGTRPAVVMVLVESLIAAGLPPRNIVVWDKQRLDLLRAGYFELAKQFGIRVEGSADAGYDSEASYNPDIPFLGPLLWNDRDFGRTEEGAGRKSYVSRLLTKEITKIINVSPLLNHYGAGVTGILYSLAVGSVDNTQRFEVNPGYLSQAVPEIYAIKEIGDKAVLNIVDALICQYQGQKVGMLHYSTTLNELRFSKDPVALDALSLEKLSQQRSLTGAPALQAGKELLENASLLELGISKLSRILIERLN